MDAPAMAAVTTYEAVRVTTAYGIISVRYGNLNLVA